MKLTKNQVILLILVLILTFILIYSPHFKNPYPLHIDEYHHITEAIKIKQGIIPQGLTAAKAGFHVILAFISLFSNLTITYKFLPAIWAVLSALTLFMLIKNKTSNLKKNFLIALFTVIFFISIKSNVNITGLWFFTPLIFSIPFIFLYIYFFSEGLQKQNKKMILISLIIMIFLIVIHSISVLFAVPILIIYSFFHLNFIKKQYKFFLLFLIIPILGILFYSFLMNISITNAITSLLSQLQFKSGWGVLEIKNSFFELYSPVGYILAVLGIIYITNSKQKLKKYLIYILWPLIVLIYLFIFKFSGTSFLSPFQRNLYYFAISLPFLSSLGLYYLILKIKKLTNKINNKKTRKITYKIIIIILIIIILIFTFKSYYTTPEALKLYKTIDKNNYEAIRFLSDIEPKPLKIMAPPEISTAIFPISQHEPVGTLFFYGNREDVDSFFMINDCNVKNQILIKNNVSFILSETPIECGWEAVYNQNNIIYRVQ
ncbi:MAG: hypothetical protein ABIH37_03270 [archaeon]